MSVKKWKYGLVRFRTRSSETTSSPSYIRRSPSHELKKLSVKNISMLVCSAEWTQCTAWSPLQYLLLPLPFTRFQSISSIFLQQCSKHGFSFLTWNLSCTSFCSCLLCGLVSDDVFTNWYQLLIALPNIQAKTKLKFKKLLFVKIQSTNSVTTIRW